jgi:DNA-binding LacI/PurR family transcriptional regulator
MLVHRSLLAGGAVLLLGLGYLAACELRLKKDGPPVVHCALIGDFSGPLGKRALAGALAAAEDRGASLDLSRTDDDQPCRSPNGVILLSPLPERDSDSFAAGEPLFVTFGRRDDAGLPACHVGVGGFGAGRIASRRLVECWPSGGRVVVLKPQGAGPNADHRFSGLCEGLRAAEAVASAQGAPRRWDVQQGAYDPARPSAESLRESLQSSPPPNCIVDVGDERGAELIEFLAASLDRPPPLVTFDDSQEVFEAIRDGANAEVVAVDPRLLAYQAVDRLTLLARGPRIALPAPGRGMVLLNPTIFGRREAAELLGRDAGRQVN